MHELRLDANGVGRDGLGGARERLTRGRLLAVQGAALAQLDGAEAAKAMVLAARLAPADPLVLRLASDLEGAMREGLAAASGGSSSSSSSSGGGGGGGGSGS